MGTMSAIETAKITKRFNSLTAVDSVTLSVKQGEIFGLLGPNGAGKTTLISMLVTMRRPDSGSATVNGFNVSKQPDDVRRSIGIVFQDQSLDEELTAYENLELHAAMYGIGGEERKKRIKGVLEMVELYGRKDDQVKTFSGGMRRRLEIARGLIHYPKVLFLDEPTLGLDPQTRKHIWEYVKKLKKEKGITILLTTHYMDEADLLCDRIAIIDHGKIIALDTGDALKNSLGGDTIVIETECNEELGKLLKKMRWVKKTACHNGKLTLEAANGEKRIPELLAFAKDNKIEVKAVSLRKPTLDDVFLNYTGRTIREEDATAKDRMRIRGRAWGRR